ncbi:MAG: hypothetical protein HZB26_16025 [Candidatus Hydrogenedentes bacterium]|nr:hypothetical protein [Candidatus Hydrogenedentota bacterium]
MNPRALVAALCLAALTACPKPTPPVLGFPGPLAIHRWDTTFSNGLPITIFYPDTPAKQPRPVVIFSAGWNQTRGSYFGYGEQLAQWGYIGIIRAYPNPSLLGIGIDTSEQQTQQVTDLIDWCAAEGERAESPLFGTVDIARVGTIGHSFGAFVALSAAVNDPRIRAVVDLDSIVADARSSNAALLRAQLAATFTPILWIGTDKGAFCSGPRGPFALPLFDLANSPSEEVIVHGAAHIDFLEQSVGLNNLGQIICGGGTIDQNEARAIAARYMISWFNVYLQGQDDFRTYLDGESAMQDVAAGKVSIRVKPENGTP